MTIIAIEAADSMGKDTLIDLIKVKHPYFEFLNFPDETSSSGIFTRKILSNGIELPPIVLQHLFISNFFERFGLLSHFKASEYTLILNRYFMSTLAYSIAQDIDITHFKHIIKLLPHPDLWILLEGERRGQSVGDRHDIDQELQTNVMNNFRELFKNNPQHNCKKIINDSTPEAMLEKFEKELQILNRE